MMRLPAPITLAYGAALAVMILLPLIANAYHIHVLSILLVHVLIAVSLNLVMGYIGMFSLGHVALLGLGAYAMANLFFTLGLFYPVAVLGGALFTALVGAIVVLPALRLNKLYLSIVTLSFAMFVHWLFIHGGAITHGASGMIIPRPDFGWLGLSPASGIFYLTLFAVVVTLRCVYNIVASPIGRSMLCVADQPHIAAGLGIGSFRLKLGVFAVSAFIAGLAGGLYGGIVSVVDPASFHILSIILQFMMVIVGGLGAILGSVLGGATITIALEALRPFAGLWEIAFGAALLLSLLFMPNGMYGYLVRFAPSFRERRHVHHVRAAEVLAPTGAGANGARSTSDASPPVIEISELVKSFGGVRAIDGVSLRVEAGTVHGIIGPNGSGKSTLINLISAHERPDSGRIVVQDRDIATLPEHAVASLGVSRTYQNLHLVKDLTVLENVLLGLHPVARVSPAMVALRAPAFLRQERAQIELARGALDFVGLSEFTERLASELSGGQMRLVELARAVVGEPRLILMDEPAAGLSIVRIDTLKALVRRINRELGVTVVMVEHVMNVVMEVSDRITVLDTGRILAEGVPSTVRADDRVRDVYFGRTREANGVEPRA